MSTYAVKNQNEKSQSGTKSVSKAKTDSNEFVDFFDQRPESEAQSRVQEIANRSSQSIRLSSFQQKADFNTNNSQPVQLKKYLDLKKGGFEQGPIQGKFKPIQKNENKTGLPDTLKLGMESLSGVSMDDVKVHLNSKKPEALHAHAFAQGTDIHVGPGQEKHLPHEAWHVVQQKQGRVKATVKVNGDVPVNDSQSLEQEATYMGQKALNNTTKDSKSSLNQASIQTPTAQLWGLPSWAGVKKKGEEYYDQEKGYKKEGDKIIDKEHEGGFLKGAVGGALGTVGGILGGIGGGLWGAGKSLFGKGDVKKDKEGKDVLDENGKPVKKGFLDQVRSSAYEGGTAGRDMGRVTGAGIVDGTKAIAGGVTGLATGAVGGALGGLAGIGHGIYNKATGKGSFSGTVKRDAKAGAKGGFNLGKGAVDASFGLVEEAPELAINASRGALGAAGGVLGAIGGGIYGGIKGAVGNGDRKFTGKAGESNENVKRRGILEQMWKSGKEGAAYGAKKGANSNLTKKVIGAGASAAAFAGGSLLAGPAGGLAAGYAASRANSRYWGETNTSADISAGIGLASSATGGLITPQLAGLGNAPAYYAAKGGNAIAGMGVTEASNAVEQNFAPSSDSSSTQTENPKVAEADTRGWKEKLSDGASYVGKKGREGASFVGSKISDLGNEVEQPYTLETKWKEQKGRIKSLFGIPQKPKLRKKSAQRDIKIEDELL